MRTVLVVDDDIFNLRHVSSILGKDYSVLTTMSGREALRVLEELEEAKQLDSLIAVVADIRMPGMDGFELLTQLRNRFAGTPVIMCSGVNQRASVMKAVQLGAKDYILKPFEADILRQKLDRLVHS